MDESSFAIGYLVGSILIVAVIPALIGGFFRRKRPPSEAATTVALLLGGFLAVGGIYGGVLIPNLVALAVLGGLYWARRSAWKTRQPFPPPLPEQQFARTTRSLGGWHRLYLTLCAVLLVPALLVWVAAAPAGPDKPRYAAGCYQYDIAPMTQAKALEISQHDEFPNLERGCRLGITAIADGTEYQRERASWLNQFGGGAAVLLGMLATLYAIGWAAGWIWRGFFPKNSES